MNMIATPEWTEYRKKDGLDPLGMHNTSVGLYQTLLSGVSKGPTDKPSDAPLGSETDGWPRLIGQLLFAFFGGNRPAIHHLEIGAIHDKLPDDILESRPHAVAQAGSRGW
jgi:hypothetical protein